jgi:ATP-binding cassette subfamily F protein uup
MLAREFARHSNLLVLDEPTNDLDLETLDLLQEVIADYDGTVLIVSHDRDFLDRTVTVTLGLDGSGKVDVVVGGYAEWVKQRGPRPELRSEAKPSPPRNGEGGAGAVSDMPGAYRSSEAGLQTKPGPQAGGGGAKRKLSYKDQRDLDLLPAEIEKLEAAIARDEAALADPDLFTRDPKRFDQLMKAIEKARSDKEAAEMRWLELAEMAETLAS